MMHMSVCSKWTKNKYDFFSLQKQTISAIMEQILNTKKIHDLIGKTINMKKQKLKTLKFY